MEEEIRKEIPRLPKGKYFVSNLGRVKNGKVKCRKGRILKFEHNRYGHQRIKLYGDGGRNDVRHYQVHRLVYCVFNNLNYDCGLTFTTGLVCHKDNNPLNNRLDNLYIGTAKDNMQQCIKDGRFKFLEKKVGECVHNSKLTSEVVKEIIDRIGKGEKQENLAKEYNVSKSTINGVRKGRTRKHVARKTSGEFSGTPTGTILSEASQGGDERAETNERLLDQ